MTKSDIDEHEQPNEECKGISFFIAYPHSKVLEVVADLEKYLNEPFKYIISKEIAKGKHEQTNGEHYHFYVYMDDIQYDRYRKTILSNKYKLSGQAKNGKSRQYGKVKDIRDVWKMQVYILKDGTFISKGYTDDEIELLLKESYKKDDVKSIMDECILYLQNQTDLMIKLSLNSYTEYDVQLAILSYYLDNEYEKLPTKHTIKYILLKIYQYIDKNFYNVNELKNLEGDEKLQMRKNLLNYILK